MHTAVQLALVALLAGGCGTRDDSQSETAGAPQGSSGGDLSTNDGAGNANVGTGPDAVATLPAAAPGSDLARLESATLRVVGTTFVDLNQRLRRGAEFDDRQSACLQAFDAALGQPILAIDCPTPIGSASRRVSIRRAALGTTMNCIAALAMDEFARCRLQFAELRVNARFVNPGASDTDGTETEDNDASNPGGRPGRPQPVFTGALIEYGVDGPFVVLTGDPSGLIGPPIVCRYELASSSVTPIGGFGNCGNLLDAVADELDMPASTL